MFHKMGRTGIPLPARLSLSRFTSDQDCVTFLFVDYMSRLGGGPIRQPSIMMIWSKKYFSCFLFFGVFFLSCQMIWLCSGHRVGGLTIVFQVLRPSCWFLTRQVERGDFSTSFFCAWWFFSFFGTGRCVQTRQFGMKSHGLAKKTGDIW